MRSLYICLSAVLLSVSVQGFNFSHNGWSMTIADNVTAEEGGSAVLPCSFTHQVTNLTLTGSVIWIKYSKGVIFNCTYPGTGHSKGELCENVKQRDGGNRFRFVGNLSNKDVSIIMDGLSQKDNGSYQCRVELNIDSFETSTPTKLEVKAARGSASVVSGTEGDTVTLPCIFEPWPKSKLATVTWLRKEPYQRIVTFTAQSKQISATVNGGNRYELIGNPEDGNASTRINQLRVSDNHTYLCQVEYRSRDSASKNFQHLIQKEIWLQVHVKRTGSPTVHPFIFLIIIFIIVIIIIIIFIIIKKKGGAPLQIKWPTPWKRNGPGSSSIPRTDQAQQPTAPDQDGSSFYVEIDNNRTGGKRFTISASEDPQPDSCTYASIMFDSNKKVQRGQTLPVVDSGETDVTYAAIVKTH
ncbi:sialic acid-binding Ig-like lectin 12 [Stegostoma tigrinum]|uniref:sialic acid-binding Ig-like lectin 12 n=1 Tax=Stegostoma tigrinum TaxID=3053191 RepID=UPI00286FEEF4|nr:sialic acid-binding Ig-like lectin 12 [Stegostoma tigrinum]XP_059501028.1 sialic acid-binding Ig-like lectin 12 [Stegostoma tigrinum]